MKHERFKELDDNFMSQVNNVLHGKGQHYKTSGDDRFSNFREAAVLGGVTTLDQLSSSLNKHIIAFSGLLRKFGSQYPLVQYLEHGGDIINYIRLIHAYLREGEVDEETCNHPECAEYPCCQLTQDTMYQNV